MAARRYHTLRHAPSQARVASSGKGAKTLSDENRIRGQGVVGPPRRLESECRKPEAGGVRARAWTRLGPARPSFVPP